MKRLAVLILISFCLISLNSAIAETKKSSPTADENIASSSQKTGDSSYILGPGDILGIEVWKDESLTRAVVILPDGKISYPLIGELMAGGKTIFQLKKEIEQKLVKYVSSPTINIEVKQPSSMYIYVLGKVNSPGRFLMTSNINVLQGIATSGGLNPFAKKNDIKIYRQENDKTNIFEFEYDDVTDGQNLQQNILLKRGDVIIVP